MNDPEEEYRSSKVDYEEWFAADLDNDEEEINSVSYNTNNYISGPFRTGNGTVPVDLLEFDHSFAYDCQRYFNLCVADPETIIFASGNYLHFFDASSGDMRFRRCSKGGGIGHITKNPVINHIAVGENGIDPPIIIYEWPSMNIVTILKQGTTRLYSHLNYSPDGMLLLSQGGDPDYTITVWNWRKSKILLRCKSHGQDIYNVGFSPTVSGHLTTSGAGHIKFWKMARTFTGLKLKGQLGRFGKTEISDIIGVHSMPDEKVISGCEWGNILVWDEDLIKFEVCKNNRKPCHDNVITQFEYINGADLVSIGMDGWIRVWYYETIDQADPPEDDRFLEIEPSYEFQISQRNSDDSEETSMLMCIEKKNHDDPEETLWYAQDGNGGLWLIDLGTFEEPKKSPRKLLTCHAGPVTCMDVSTWGTFVATCGKDGHLHIYNYSTKKLILVEKIRDKGSRIVWFPCSIEATGTTLAWAFESGIVRIVTVNVSKANESHSDLCGNYMRLLQVIKPHKSAITAMSLNPSNSLLITGSEDSTIFVFSIKITKTYPILSPIGYIKLFSGVSCISWKPENNNTIFVGCYHGDCAELELPDQQQDYTRVSYELIESRRKYFKFQSVKSKIRRELARLSMEKRKEEKRAAKREQMEKLIMENPGIEIDEEEFLMDDEEDSATSLPEIFVPEVPNPVLMANYTSAGTIWLSMGGFDAGYFYEYPIPEINGSENLKVEPMKSRIIVDADDTEISCCLVHKKYLFLGLEHGEIRVCRINPQDHTDLSDYLLLPMHDNQNGKISAILTSRDEKMLFTCGQDGNLFSYNINDDDGNDSARIEFEKSEKAFKQLPVSNVEDIIDEPDYPSLEEVKIRTESDRIVALAKSKKNATLKVVRTLTEEYNKIIERNLALPKSQRLTQEDLELDPRITADLNDHLKAEMDLVHKKLAFKVEKSRLGLEKLVNYFIEPITCLPFAVCRISKPDTMIHSLRERKLGDDFPINYAEVVKRIEEKNKASSDGNAAGQCEKPMTQEIPDVNILEAVEEEDEDETKKVDDGLESFFKNPAMESNLGVQINQMLRKYRARKKKMEKRSKEWKIMWASKPDPEKNHPDDIAAIERAKSTIGDYKLKTLTDFSKSSHNDEERETTLTKYKQILDCRKKTHNLREDFNSRLRSLRDEKLSLQDEITSLIGKLKDIHGEIPEKSIKPLPIIPVIDQNIEYPEKNLELEKYISMAERVEETKRKKMSITEEMIINPMDEEYEVLLLDKRSIDTELEASIISLDITIPEVKSSNDRLTEILKSLDDADRVETTWEREMKRHRVMKKIYEQDTILRNIEKNCKNFDRRLDELEVDRLEISADSVYSDIYLLALHQELIVLKDFESMENILSEKVREKSAERQLAERKIRSITNKIEQRNREIAKYHDKIKDLQSKFINIIRDNKFADFLRRIYRKKFKQSKNNEDDESSTSSSSDSSSDDRDGASTASDDIGPLHLDENICPIGCDRELYDATFSMRQERYDCEHGIKEGQKIIETARKEIDADMKKFKIIDNELIENRKNLEDFMREKQRKLNDIDMTVILKFHQLQHFVDDNNVADIRDCVVFDETKLSHLYARVGELQQETLEQKAKHEKNRTHLHRMKVDCKYMEGEIKRLKDQIKQEMMQKFGRQVSLDALYEGVLRRMLYNVKSDLKKMTKEYDGKIKCVKDKYYEQVQVLEGLIQENTEKLSFLSILEAEQMKLKKILRHPPESEEKMLMVEAEYKKDIEHFEEILKNQRHQKELFRNDIRNLRLKSRPPTQFCKNDKEGTKKLENNDDKHSERITSLKDTFGVESEEESSIHEDFHVEDDYENKEESIKIVDETNKQISQTDSAAAMVHRLLSRIIEGDDNEASERFTRDIIKQVIKDLPIDGGLTKMREIMEISVDRIIGEEMPLEDEETIDAMRDAVKDSLHDIFSRVEDETRDLEMTNIDWNPRQKINDLLESMGINRDARIVNEILRLLRNDAVEDAMDYLSSKVDTSSDVEKNVALREHAFRILTEIKENIESNHEVSGEPIDSSKKPDEDE